MRRPCACAFVALVLAATAACTRADPALAPATIVIFNSTIPESAELAKFYAQKRGIARDHLVGLACSHEEEISRDDYDRTIAKPLREIFSKRNWWTVLGAESELPTVQRNAIHFVALIKGMPLKVRAAAAYPGDKPEAGPIGNHNGASVDSEISTLARFAPQISGAVTNPYFQSYRSILEADDMFFMLVCRLDAPSAETVRRMITDAIETEKTGLWGRAYVDGAHNSPTSPLGIGDVWLGEIVQQLHSVGVPVVYDDAPAMFPDGFPMSDCALYYGWYSASVAGPFVQPTFRFNPGAIAVHIHSFSANTLRDPNANWAAPLLTKGAAATIGNVYEPYLQLTTHLDILNDRLLHGFTFAESSYMATQALSWMQVMLGDPLYRPYANWLQIDSRKEAGKGPSEWKMYHDFAVQNVGKPAAEYRALARQASSRARNASMIEDLGLMEAHDGKFASAANHFQQARTMFTKRDDILRVVLEEADSWLKQEKPKRAVDLVRSVLKIVPDSPTATLLKKIEQENGPPMGAPQFKP
ncbi:MAG: TIGR03790 family protein [Verrucomicrobiota bacterium]|nr:TIGR03790 family protein [Verrucomicrobiota bacterium]